MTQQLDDTWRRFACLGAILIALNILPAAVRAGEQKTPEASQQPATEEEQITEEQDTEEQDTEEQDTEEQDTEEQPVATIRGEVVVTSTLPELGTEERFSGKQVERAGRQDLAQFVRDIPGGAAVRRGVINMEPSLRGLQEDQVATFVDGTRTFAAGPARMDSNLSHVGTHMVQNLRVVKGPYALTWGAGTLSALRIETPRPQFSPDGFSWNGVTGGTWGSNASSLDSFGNVWGAGERFRFYVGVGRRQGDDYEAGDGSMVPADHESTEGRWRFGFQPRENLLLEYSGGYQEQKDLDYPGRLLDATYFYTRSYGLELTWTGEGMVREVYGQLYNNRKDHRMNNNEKPTGRDMPGRIPPFALKIDLPTESNTLGGRFHVALERNRLTMRYGLDGYRLEQTATRTVARRSDGRILFEDAVWPDAQIENLGGYGQWVFRGDGYELGTAVRIDAVDATADGLTSFYLDNTAGDPSQSETNLSAALSARFDLGKHWSLSAGLGRAVRTATVLERYSDRFPATKFQLAAEFMGNPELDPETSLEFNLGLKAHFGELFFEVDAFVREIDDYITITADPSLPRRLPLSPPVVFRYINGSPAAYYGGELRLRQRLGTRFSWHGSLSWVRAEDEELDEPVLGIAPFHGLWRLRYTTAGQGFWGELGVRFADRQDRVAVSRFEQETPGWAVVDLAVGVHLADRWRLRLAVENLTDHAYREHLNAPNPFTGARILEMGRDVKIGFEVDF